MNTALSQKKWWFRTFLLIIVSIAFYYFINKMENVNETIEKIEILFLPLGVFSSSLSILIVKEISEIREDYHKKAAREIYDKALDEKEELNFYISYTKVQDYIDIINYDLDGPKEMKINIEKLERIDVFLSKFPKIAMKRYGKNYKDSYNIYLASLDDFQDHHIKNNHDLINAAKLCIMYYVY